MEEGNWGKQQNPESLMPDSALCAEHRINTAILQFEKECFINWAIL